MNEKIIKYFADEMSPLEREEFEELISKTPSLQEEISKYRTFFSDIASTRKPEINEDYFVNMIPNFRQKLEQGEKKKYHPVFSFASAILTVIIVLLFIPRSNKVIHNTNVSADYSTSEISDYLTTNSEQPLVSNLPDNVEANYDSVLDGMIYDELSNNGRNVAGSDLVDGLDYNTLLESVNSNDASTIYEQLKNKKIF